MQLHRQTSMSPKWDLHHENVTWPQQMCTPNMLRYTYLKTAYCSIITSNQTKTEGNKGTYMYIICVYIKYNFPYYTSLPLPYCPDKFSPHMYCTNSDSWVSEFAHEISRFSQKKSIHTHCDENKKQTCLFPIIKKKKYTIIKKAEQYPCQCHVFFPPLIPLMFSTSWVVYLPKVKHDPMAGMVLLPIL